MPVVHPALFCPSSPGERVICLLSLLSCFCYYTISKSALNIAPLKWFMLRPSDLLIVQSSDSENSFHLLPFLTCPEVWNCWLCLILQPSPPWVYVSMGLCIHLSVLSGYPATTCFLPVLRVSICHFRHLHRVLFCVLILHVGVPQTCFLLSGFLSHALHCSSQASFLASRPSQPMPY